MNKNNCRYVNVDKVMFAGAYVLIFLGIILIVALDLISSSSGGLGLKLFHDAIRGKG